MNADKDTSMTTPSHANDGIEKSRRALAKTASYVFLPIVCAASLGVIAIVWAAFWELSKSVNENDIFNLDVQAKSVLFIHLVKVGAGLSVGMLCFFLGATVCWLNLPGSFEASGAVAANPINFKGTNAGLLIIAAGLTLTSIALTRPVDISDGAFSIGSASGQRDSASLLENQNLDESLKAAIRKLRSRTRQPTDTAAIDRVMELLQNPSEL